MPTYEYSCDGCGRRLVHRLAVADRDPVGASNDDVECPGCGPDTSPRRVPSSAHPAPVPGVGNHPYARKIQQRAKRNRAKRAERQARQAEVL